jgi:hypothetical protein
MSIATINIFVSDVAEPCGTWNGTGRATVFDCNGILTWPCGRFRPAGATAWQPVPNGSYRNLPFRCGHLEVEVPPGCYWVIAGSVTPGSGYIHLNYTTHVGIVQVCCGQDACVKLYNPTIRLCWNWFLAGLQILAARGGDPAINPDAVRRLEEMVEQEILKNAPMRSIEKEIGGLFQELARLAETGDSDLDKELKEDKNKDGDKKR